MGQPTDEGYDDAERSLLILENGSGKSVLSTDTPSNEAAPTGFDLFRAWKEYEGVAMHFNELLIRLRTQSLAAAAAFATIAGVLLKGSSLGEEIRWGTLLAVFSVLSVLWVAIWVLDFTYYNRLLLGAVRALLAIEEASGSGARLTKLSLSTEIEAAVRKGDSMFSREYWGRAKGRWVFYTTVFLVLLAGAAISVVALGGPSGVLRVIENQTAPGLSS